MCWKKINVRERFTAKNSVLSGKEHLKLLQQKKENIPPAINIQSTIMSSSNFPDKTANSAIPSASPPAEIVPKERLNPLFKVAPTPK